MVVIQLIEHGLKVEITKIIQQHGMKCFQRSLSPSLNFAIKSSLDDRTLMCECGSMLHDNWLDIPCVVILHSFCFKPRMVSDKNTQRNIFIIIFLCSFHKGIIAKGESWCCLPKVLVLGQKLILGKPLNCAFKLVKWFPLQHQPLDAYLKIHTTRFAIFMINICIYNHPFKVFMNMKCNNPGFWRSQKYELFKNFPAMCEACRCKVKQRTIYK